MKLSSSKTEPLIITAVNIAARAAHLLFFIVIGNKYGSSTITDSVITLLAPLVVLTGIVSGAADVVAMPVFHKARNKNDAKYIYRFFLRRIICYLIPSSVLITIITSLFCNYSDFFLILILSPIPLLASLSALKAGILNASNRFRASVSGPFFGAITAVFFLLIAPVNIYCFALSFLLFEAGKISGLYLFRDITSGGNSLKTDFSSQIITWGYRNVKLQLIASLILSLIYPIDIWFAGTLGEGSVTFVEYANKLWNVIPLFFAGHIALTYYSLSKAVNKSSESFETINIHNVALRYLLLGTIASCIVIFTSDSLIRMSFGIGKISIQQQASLSGLLDSYLAGAGFYVGGLVYVRMMSATGRTDILLIIACLSLLCNIICDVLFIKIAGLNGIGFATSTVYFCNFFLFAYLYERTEKTNLLKR